MTAMKPVIRPAVPAASPSADAGTDTSAALHRRYGFTDAGRLAAVGYKHDRWVDTLLMQRTLGHPATDTADLDR
ncbi:N-acetyltransferase family protein [Streptomyces parvus]